MTFKNRLGYIRKIINPPYSPSELVIIFVGLFLLLAIPLTVIVSVNRQTQPNSNIESSQGRVIAEQTSGPPEGWGQVNKDGFGNPCSSTERCTNDARSFTVHEGNLYAAATNKFGTNGQIWRTTNGTSWEKIIDSSFPPNAFRDNGTLKNSFNITDLLSFEGYIYVADSSYSFDDDSGTYMSKAAIFRSNTGDSNTWVQVGGVGLGFDGNSFLMGDMEVFKDKIYVTIQTISPPGVAMMRSGNGTTWTQVGELGLGSLFLSLYSGRF